MILSWCQGRPSPWDHDAFPPLFQISPSIFKKCSDSVENFLNFTFSRKISLFPSAKICDDLFFSHRPQISNSPPHFRLFRENYYSPLLFNISLCFRKIYLLSTYFLCISFAPLLLPWCIYASPILDVPGWCILWCYRKYMPNNNAVPLAFPWNISPRLCKAPHCIIVTDTLFLCECLLVFLYPYRLIVYHIKNID